VFEEKYAIASPYPEATLIFGEFFKFGMYLKGSFLYFIVRATAIAQARPSDAYFLHFNFGLYQSKF